jgi:pyruvate dehydrogenase E2 component (dihydrolipoamide acetyltransferase)
VLPPSVLSPSVLSPSVLSPSVLPPSVSAVAVHTAVTSPVSPTSSEATAALRRAIAVTMARSKREIPHYYLWQRVDLWTTLAWLDEENARRPVTMRVLPIVLVARAVARAARAFPDLNGTLHDGAYFAAADVNLCFATSLRGGGLVAPALAGADRLDVEGLRLGLAGLVARVRGGGLSARELTSGTLTLSNLGDLGVDGVLPVIQPPQVAIVGVGRITQAAVVDRGAVVAHPVVTLTLAADHRVSDGQRGARFLRAIEDHLLHPERP